MRLGIILPPKESKKGLLFWKKEARNFQSCGLWQQPGPGHQGQRFFASFFLKKKRFSSLSSAHMLPLQK
jgi:hypothetical protein